MNTIYVSKIDETSLRVDASDQGILMELHEHFTFYANNYQFMPAYRNKMWDGKIRLFNSRERSLPFGLIHQLYRFAKGRGYTIDPHSSLSKDIKIISRGEVEWLDNLPLRNGGKVISIRDYQMDAIKTALTSNHSLLISPTGSGKSLIIYAMVRWFLKRSDKKIVIVTPTTSLVEQMTSDFADYSSADPRFNADEMIHKIYSGQEKEKIDKRVVITTWQSVYKMPKKWFDQFEGIIGDEAHTFQAKSLTSIMSKLTRAWLRVGTSGSLDGSLVSEMQLEASFGPITKVISTRKLIDDDVLSDLSIDIVVLEYPDQEKKKFGKKTYMEEITYITGHDRRNRFIKNLALNQTGNTLVLYNLVQNHGKPLHEMISREAEKGRRVFFVSGDVDVDKREEIRKLTETQDNAIIVASMGTFSTGINIKNLHNIIFAAPTKSQIRVLQSIGRSLRKAENGRAAKIYDICDNLAWKSRKNYTLKHGIERAKIYAKEKHVFKTYNVPLG